MLQCSQSLIVCCRIAGADVNEPEMFICKCLMSAFLCLVVPVGVICFEPPGTSYAPLLCEGPISCFVAAVQILRAWCRGVGAHASGVRASYASSTGCRTNSAACAITKQVAVGQCHRSQIKRFCCRSCIFFGSRACILKALLAQILDAVAPDIPGPLDFGIASSNNFAQPSEWSASATA